MAWDCSRALCNLKRRQSDSQQNETCISSLQYFWNLRNLNLDKKPKWKAFFEGFVVIFFSFFFRIVIHCLTHKSSISLCFNAVHIIKNNLKDYQLASILSTVSNSPCPGMWLSKLRLSLLKHHIVVAVLSSFKNLWGG